MKLGYSHSYVPGPVESRTTRTASRDRRQPGLRRVRRATTPDRQPAGSAGQFPWMTESQWGVIFPCNLDPDIPGGKGHFCKDALPGWA